ncbi:MAG TPA: polysaccharide biosynthesis/export family protein, partial [Gemmatimonadaceae bacterium]
MAARAQTGSGAGETARRAANGTLRPGDRIELQFRSDRDLNAGVTVTERGDAMFPKLGALDVTGMTIAALQDTLRSRYSDYLRTP